MARVKGGVTAHARHKKIIKAAKGYRGRRKNTFRTANAAVEKAGVYNYRDRKVKKRTFRQLWQARINAAARASGITYSRLIEGLKAAKCTLDRKVIADIAAQDASAFGALVKQAQDALKAKASAPKVVADDLVKIEGVGPKINELLKAAGIVTFVQLASTSVARLKEILAAGGSVK